MINYEIIISYVGNIVCKLEVTKCCDRMKRNIWSYWRGWFEDNRLTFAAPFNMENTCRFRQTWSSLMEGEGFSRDSIHIYVTTHHYIPEDIYHALFPFSSIFGHLVNRKYVRTKLKHPAQDRVPWNQNIFLFLFTIWILFDVCLTVHHWYE